MNALLSEEILEWLTSLRETEALDDYESAACAKAEKSELVSPSHFISRLGASLPTNESSSSSLHATHLYSSIYIPLRRTKD